MRTPSLAPIFDTTARYPAWLQETGMAIFWLAILTIASTPSFLLAQDQAPQVTATTVDGREFAFRLQGIGSDQKLSSPDLSAELLPDGLSLSEIMQINFVMDNQDAINDQVGKVRMRLINGSRFAIDAPTLRAETVTFTSVFQCPPLPMEIVRSLIWSDSELVQQQLDDPSSSEDTVIVQTDAGDRMVTGLIKKIDPQQLEFEYQGQVRKINIERIRALVLADLGLGGEQHSGLSVTLIDGSLLKGEFSTLTSEKLALQLAAGVTLDIALAKIRTVEITSDRLRYLSDLDPVGVEQRTLFTLQRDWQRDRSVQQNTLAIRDHQTGQIFEFRKGLGTQAYTRVDFANAENYQTFLATVGIAAETQGRGDCQMQVLGDGVELWSARVKGTDAPRDIEVDIRGVNQISLVVDFGESLDLSDHANWCNARLVK